MYLYRGKKLRLLNSRKIKVEKGFNNVLQGRQCPVPKNSDFQLVCCFFFTFFFLEAGPLFEILSYKKPEYGAALIGRKASSQICLGGHRAQDQLRASPGE